MTSPRRGMTLIEVIMVVTISTTMIFAIGTSISNLYKYNAYSFAQSNEVAEARRGMNRLVRDIREMTYGEDGSYPLRTMSAHRLGFYSDIDRDNSVEYVEFVVASTTLYKNIYNATGTVASYSTTTIDEQFIISEYVQNINQSSTTFSYYDTNGLLATATTSISDIRYIDVNLIVNIDPIRDPGEFLLRSSAALRNLKDNL